MLASKGKAVWIIAALGLFVLAPTVARAADEPCNGAVELCDRPLDQVVLPGTHNSMSNAEEGWILPNQSYSISNQLKLGIRAMLIDTHYGKPGSGVHGVEGATKSDATGTYLCHENCIRGASPLVAELNKVAGFLEANPREVLVFVNEDHIMPLDFGEAVDQSGLLPYVYRASIDSYPTLGEMIDSGQRVVMLAEQNAAGVDWYHRAYDGAVMETPYSFVSNDENPNGGLDDPAKLNQTCQPNRGQPDPSPLFLMNHWVTTSVVPQPQKAAIVNQREELVARARACEVQRGKLPNILAVDFFGQGDLIGAARELNGLPDPLPEPEPVDPKPILTVGKPKSVKVRSKRKATFRVKVYNSGDAASGRVKVCAKVPSKLARKPRCSTIASVPVNRTRTATLRIKTKKRYRKGSGRVRFSAFSSGPTLKASARLTVKPLKKHKRRR